MSKVLSRQQVIVMGAGAALLAVVLGVRQGFGFYLVPMTIDLGWSRELFGLAMAIQNLLWGASAFRWRPCGPLRLGPRHCRRRTLLHAGRHRYGQRCHAN